MTKFRAPIAVLGCALALSASAATADVFKTVKLTDVLITGATGGPQDDLPAPPPKLAGTPKGSSPQANPGPTTSAPKFVGLPAGPRAAQIRTQPLWGVRYGGRY